MDVNNGTAYFSWFQEPDNPQNLLVAVFLSKQLKNYRMGTPSPGSLDSRAVPVRSRGQETNA
jgi:hypothetical protein